MATAPVVHTALATIPPATKVTGITRFIDTVKAFFVKAEPVVEEVETLAQEAEPILAFTPAGPEYKIAVDAIVGAQQTAATALAVGTSLTTTQKGQIAIQAATPALNAILTSKGITADTETHIANWIQNVFNILAGPVAKIVKTIEGPTPTVANTTAKASA